MFWFGLLIAVCYVPGYTGALIPSQWAVLSIALPFGLWRVGALGSGHWVGLVVLAWSAVSLFWAPNFNDAVYGLWCLSICSLAVWFGTTVRNPIPLFQGLAAGLAVSSLVAIAQWYGLHPVEVANGYPGLMFNPTVLGAATALVLIALVCMRQWLYIPPLIPALLLSQSRGAWVILVATALTQFIHVRWVLVLGACTFAAATIWPGPSDIQRLMLWGMAIRELNLLGHGIGSFTTYLFYNPNEYYRAATGMIHPEFVHNDYLQLWFELGIGALGVYFIYFLAFRQRFAPLWPVWFGFAMLGFFYFPLYCSITAFIGCVVTGRLLRHRHRYGRARANRRQAGLPWGEYQKLEAHAHGSRTLSL